MLPRFKPRRCARAYTTIAKDAVLFQAISLYNNSSGRDILAVRDLTAWTGTQANVYSDVVQGSQGTLSENGVCIVTGERTPPGQMFTQLIAARPTPDYLLATSSNSFVPWVHDYPFELLLPGWSLRLTIDTANAATLEVGFVWQWCNAEDIDGSLADLELKLAGG